MKLRNLAKAALFGLIAVILFGCDAGKYTGGGFIDSAAGGDQKATFGFQLEGVDRDGDGQVDMMVAPDPACPDYCFDLWWLGKGQFQFNDHGAGVKFHFDCDLTTSLPSNGTFPPGMFARFNDDFTAITGFMWYGPYKTGTFDGGQVNVVVTARSRKVCAKRLRLERALPNRTYAAARIRDNAAARAKCSTRAGSIRVAL